MTPKDRSNARVACPRCGRRVIPTKHNKIPAHYTSHIPAERRECVRKGELISTSGTSENDRVAIVVQGLLAAARLRPPELEIVIDALLKDGDAAWKQSEIGLAKLLRHRDDEGWIAMKHVATPGVRREVLSLAQDFVDDGDDLVGLIERVERARRALTALTVRMRRISP